MEELLIKYFNDACSPQEEERVIAWVSQSEENKKTFSQLKNLYVRSTMPNTKVKDQFYETFVDTHINNKPTKILKNKQIFKWSIAAVLIILLGLNLAFNWLAYTPKDHTIRLSQVPFNAKTITYTEKGVKSIITLPDSSKVWLNSDSKIIYPNEFSGASREIEFSGEGYFEVAKDSLCPMIIRCKKGFSIEVYGTTFNIKSYDNDDISQATLYTGLIKIITKNGHSAIIHPNDSYIIYPEQSAKLVTLAEPKTLSAWKEGNLIFDAVPLYEAAKIMERWYGIHFIFDNKSMYNEKITASFHSESIVQIMELLKLSIGISYEINDNIITIK